MRWLDSLIAGVVPKFAIRRIQARQAIKSFYESAKVSRLHKTRGTSGSPDAETTGAIDTLRDQARHLEQNYDMARGVLDVLVDNIVGLGVVPEPQIKSEDGTLNQEANAAVLLLWRDWVRNPEVTQELDYYSAQRLKVRSWFRDGEMLTQLLSGNVRGLDHGTVVPFSLELIEGDLLPTDKTDEAKGITQGVQKNAWGRPVAYHVYKNHPGSNMHAFTRKTKKIAAKNMLHLKLVDRVKQTRGVSIFACVMSRFDDIKEIEESERVAARVAAAMAAAVKKGSPDMYVAPSGDDDYREMEMLPGMVFDELKTGEEITTIASNRPNNEVITFRDANIRAAASGVGTGASSISKNYDGSYSSQRQELVEARVHYGVLWSAFIYKDAIPVYEGFIRAAVSAGKLELPSDVDKDTIFDAEHSRPEMPWIDPAKEMKGVDLELKTEISSKSQIIRRRGGNPDEVRKQRQEEQLRDEEAGLRTAEAEETEPDEPDTTEDDKD